MNRPWTFENKIQARQLTIVDPYRKYFGTSLPDEKQYWSLCGNTASDGRVIERSEFHHMTHMEQLIKPYQFHGVERQEAIALRNKELAIGNFYFGDFYNVMIDHHSKGLFNPGIINIDTIGRVDTQLQLTKSIFGMIQSYTNILLVCNFVQKTRLVKEFNPEKTLDILLNDGDFKYEFLKNKWHRYGHAYSYKGIGKGTTMFSVVLIKK